MTPEFEFVEDGDRRFGLMETPPEFEHNIPLEQLALVKDEITREKWKLDNIIGQKLDWLIKNSVTNNNNWFHLETEIIRGKQFRKYVWSRVAIFVGLGVALLEFLVHVAPALAAHLFS